MIIANWIGPLTGFVQRFTHQQR